MSQALFRLAVSLTLLVLALPVQAAADPAPTVARSVVFISDLHLGVGRDPADSSDQPRWHALEDFRWHRELRNFLETMNRDGGKNVELVILGDFLELWQSLSKKDCRHEAQSKDLGCSEAEAVARVTRVLEQHGDAFAALSWFAHQGTNRITLVPGNHDAALLFPQVAQRVLAKIPAPPDRVRLLREGTWRAADGSIVAEHGHEIGDDPNRFQGWPEHPFIDWAGTRYLRQPWGEQMVQEVFNGFEARYPILDNLSEELRAMELAWKDQNRFGKRVVSAIIARFLLTQMSWAQLEQGMGKKPAQAGQAAAEPRFDLTKLKEQYRDTPERFVIESRPPGHPLRSALEEAAQRGEPILSLKELSDAEIETLCAQRQVLQLEACPQPEQGLRFVRQLAAEKLFSAKTQKLRAHLLDVRARVKAVDPAARPFQHLVLAHSHLEESGTTPFAERESWRPLVWNDGAWQRRVTPAGLCTLAKKRGVPEEEALETLQPEDLPACYSFILARWSQGAPEPELFLQHWIQEPGGEGKYRGNCPFEIHPACAEAKR